MKEKGNMEDFLIEKKSVTLASALTIHDVDKILNSLPNGELVAYRKSLEFYRERLIRYEKECAVSLKNEEFIASSIKQKSKAYNRKG